MKNRTLRHLFIKTGAVSAMTALIVGLGIAPFWGGVYAIMAFFGLVNWFFLACALVALTEKRYTDCMIHLGIKFGTLFAFIFFVLSQIAFPVSAFLAGFNTFLIVALLEAMGQMFVSQMKSGEDGHDPMKEFKSLFTGRPSDA